MYHSNWEIYTGGAYGDTPRKMTRDELVESFQRWAPITNHALAECGLVSLVCIDGNEISQWEYRPCPVVEVADKLKALLEE